MPALDVQFREPLHQELALILRLSPLGDIANDADEQRLVPVPRLADRQFYWERRAVLAAAFHLAADADDLALARALVVFQIAVVLLVERFRHQHLDVVTHDLILPIAEHLLASRVEHPDNPMRVDQDDAVDGRVDDSLELLGTFLERLLELILFGNVTNDA